MQNGKEENVSTRLSSADFGVLAFVSLVLLGTGCARYVRQDAQAIVLPTALREVKLEYPEAAQAQGIEGTVQVSMWIGRSGEVGRVNVYQSSGHDVLDKAALAAAVQCSFAPARDSRDLPVGVWLRRPFRFRLGEHFDDNHPSPLTPEYMKAVTMPEPLDEVEPAYPESARVLGIEGEAVVAFWLRKNGTVAFTRIVSSSGNTWLDKAALEAAQQSTFTPARDSSGAAVNIWLKRSFRFTLSKER